MYCTIASSLAIYPRWDQDFIHTTPSFRKILRLGKTRAQLGNVWMQLWAWFTHTFTLNLQPNHALVKHSRFIIRANYTVGLFTFFTAYQMDGWNLSMFRLAGTLPNQPDLVSSNKISVLNSMCVGWAVEDRGIDFPLVCTSSIAVGQQMTSPNYCLTKAHISNICWALSVLNGHHQYYNPTGEMILENISQKWFYYLGSCFISDNLAMQTSFMNK